jgi:DNA polymerase elongation subunit (family B)
MDGVFYVYSWTSDDENNRTQIRAYGIDSQGFNTALIINDFTPYVYIELPMVPGWKSICAELERDVKSNVIFTQVVSKEHLYANRGGKRYFLFCQCTSRKYIGYISYMLKNKTYNGNKLQTHEESATSVLQLISLRDIHMATWISFKNAREIIHQKLTACDRELEVSWKDLSPCSEQFENINPKILAFDLEVNSEVTNSMPSNKPGDVIFQISCVIQQNHIKTKILLTLDGNDLNDDNPLLEGIKVQVYEREEDLLDGFITLLKDEKPNAIAGYNILMFDIMYLIKRCERYTMMEDFQLAGFNRRIPAKKKTIKWSSSAYKNQEYVFIDWEGVLILDLLPIIKRDYKLENYKLDTVAHALIGAEKDPVGYKEIFSSYRSKTMARVGKYCVQDSNLCIDLLDYTHCWISLAEMAVVCKVSMFSLYTQGQQHKIYSQLYAYCLRRNIIVTSNGYQCSGNERYLGAFVMDPVPGFYENVCPLDFCSLYPSIIIAYNICYSTFVPEGNTDIPKDRYQTFEWEDHLGCEHDPKVIKIAKLNQKIEYIEKQISQEVECRDKTKGINAKKIIQERINNLREKQKPYRTKRCELKKSKPHDREDDDGNVITGIICAHRKYSFMKKEYKRGVIPTIIQNLLDSRKAVKEIMKTCTDEGERVVHDKRQLALKVSANSQYGAMGVRKGGKLSLLPAAMCITYLGREAIAKAGKIVCEKYGGTWIYTDTDSTYVTFKHLSSPEEIWDNAIDVAKKVSEEFPGLTIEFENAIYKWFLIMSKKRYMYRSIDRDGYCDGKIGKRGVVIARRDNSKYLRTVYSELVTMIFDGKCKQDVEIYLIESISDMFRRRVAFDQYIATKSIGSTDGDEEDGKLGDYKVKQLPSDKLERHKLLGSKTERQFFIESCPAQVQLAEKLRNRGFPIDVGSRMEFVVLKDPSKRTLGGRMEDAEYFMKRKRKLTIDYMYYLKSIVNPVDQLLEVGMGLKNFISHQVTYRTNYEKVLDEYRNLIRPMVIRKCLP